MGEVEDLKAVLGRIEGKLIAASKMYAALNFAVWGSVMLLYYLLIGVVSPNIWITVVYWAVAFVVAMYSTFRIWAGVQRLWGDKEQRINEIASMLIGLSWGVGAVLGWYIVPMLNPGINSSASMAMGFLSFIAISVLGMWLVLVGSGAREREMIPAFAIPAVGVPIVMYMKHGAMSWAGFLVGFAFLVTIIWYLYSAFRAIER